LLDVFGCHFPVCRAKRLGAAVMTGLDFPCPYVIGYGS
jgi:hypothetical protein